jgi:type I restriction-modification system DNA methylase subunit
MSRTAKKTIEQDAQPQLIFDAKRDINPFWKSSLFSDVYLKNNVPREYKDLWENDEYGPFYDFYQGFVDLCIATKHESFEKWKEADTVKNWIVHVMDLLGWENNSEKRSNSYMDNESFTVSENGRKQTFRPDLIYFNKPKHKTYTQKENKSDEKLAEVRDKKTGAKIVVEAKFWDRLAQNNDNKKEVKVNDSASGLGAELQTLKYMEIFDHDFGILTDGKTWRLFHKELSKGIERRSFDFDLGNLRELALDLGTHLNEEKFKYYAKYFYYFFAKKSLIEDGESKTAPFVHEVFDYSKKYALSIEDDLKKRFIVTMGIACNSIKHSCEKNNEEVDLEMIRNVSESHLFNILFVKSCEVRRILPISSTQYLRYSLHEIIETIDASGYDPSRDKDDYTREFKYTFKSFDWNGYDIFNRIINLYEIIHDGTAKTKDFGFEIEGFKESIFAKNEWKFAKSYKISNADMVDILFNLNFIDSTFKGRRYQQIPYSYFSPRQLGSIYESFLEYKLEIADKDMIFSGGRWKIANLKSKKVKQLNLVDQFVVNEDDLFFSPDNRDRKITGAFFTHENVVVDMVKRTLDKKIEKLKAEDILNIKLCDPAMGSGHFLTGALEYLTKTYREKLSSELNDDIDETFQETARRILDSCLYGVDISPRAVKLAKMSLWLQTAYPGKKLERLNDQLKDGNSFTFNWEKEFSKIFDGGGFDVVVGNPPYGAKKFNDIDSELPVFKKYIEKEIKLKDVVDGKFENINSFAMFILLSYRIIKNSGQFNLLISDTFRTILSFEKMRSYFVKNKTLKECFLAPADTFYPAVVHTCSILVDKSKVSDDYLAIDAFTQSSENYRESLNKEFKYKLPVLEGANGSPLVVNCNDEILTFLQPSNHLGVLNDEDNTFVGAYQGLATGDDKEYLAILRGADLTGLTIKTGVDSLTKITRNQICNRKLTKEEIEHGITSSKPHYVPFVKATRSARYFYESPLYINWSKESLKKMKTKKNKTGKVASRFQNKEKYFLDCMVSSGENGILSSFFVTGSVPAVSTNIIVPESSKMSAKYLCALLNSSFVSYVLRNVINGSLIGMSSHVTPSDIKRIPYMEPSATQVKKIEKLVDKIIQKNESFGFFQEEEDIDKVIFDIYKISKKTQKEILDQIIPLKKQAVSNKKAEDSSVAA